MLADQAWQGLFQIPQIAIVMGCLVPIVGVVAFYWYKAQKARSDNELKQSLVDRGLSAVEIERIMAARAKDDDDPC